jgi:hypothetical protein
METESVTLPTSTLEAVYRLIDRDLAGYKARLWRPKSARDLERLLGDGGAEALAFFGWRVEVLEDGRAYAERLPRWAVDETLELPARWIAEEVREGGEVEAWRLEGSYRAWLIGRGILSPPRARNAEGRKMLRRLGYRQTRAGFLVGVHLRPEEVGAPPTATSELTPVSHPLCPGCGTLRREAWQHVNCRTVSGASALTVAVRGG